MSYRRPDVSGHDDLSGVGSEDEGGDVEKGGLAATGGGEKGHALAGDKIEGDLVKHGAGAGLGVGDGVEGEGRDHR